jgi:hypothetical protein
MKYLIWWKDTGFSQRDNLRGLSDAAVHEGRQVVIRVVIDGDGSGPVVSHYERLIVTWEQTGERPSDGRWVRQWMRLRDN